MTFLVLLLTLSGYKLLGWHFGPQHDRWFINFCDRLSHKLGQWPRLVIWLGLMIPVALTGLLLNVSQDWLFGFVQLCLQVLILAYALGRVNLSQEVNAYLVHWQRGDTQAAYRHACEHFNIGSDFDADSTGSLHVNTCKGLLYQWFEQVFVIIFWYLLAGPLAALFIRLLSLYEHRFESRDTSQLLHLLEWLPARLIAFIFAIAGNFTQCFKIWLSVITEFKTTTEEVLFKAGLAAIALNEQELYRAEMKTQADQLKTLQALQIRCLVVCLVIVALFVIF